MSDPATSPADHPTRASGPRARTVGTRLDERLSVPWWWWPPVLALVTLLAAGMHLGYPGLRAWLPYAILLPLAVLALTWLGRPRVVVETDADGAPRLRAGRRVLASAHVGRTDIARGTAKQDALGPQLDPTAFVLQRPWIRAVVRVEVLDPGDPTPYWVVSTRHPQRLVDALSAPAAPGGDVDVTPRSRGR